MKPMQDIAVVGGGVVGAALALALRQQGFKVHLIERGAGPKPWNPVGYDLRVYAMAPASARFLSGLGVWDAILRSRASPYEVMRIWDEHPAQALRFECSEVRTPQLGHIVENDLLLDVLWQKLDGVTVHRQCDVTGLTEMPYGVMLSLSDGRSIDAGLVIAADGADSRLRELAGIETTGWAYPQKAIVAHVNTEKPHRRTALQRFLPTGPLAFLPLEDGRSSIVWSTTQADELLALDDAAFRERLREAIHSDLGEITASTPRLSFPLRLLHAHDYVRGRLVLAGDAAHVVHPLAGQGVNLGLADAQLLVELLAQARAQVRDIGNSRLLKRYERARKADNIDMLAVTDGLYRAFDTRAETWDGLRMVGMSAVNQLGPLKSLLVQRAIGS